MSGIVTIESALQTPPEMSSLSTLFSIFFMVLLNFISKVISHGAKSRDAGEYDFIVVGAGVGGSAVASRLVQSGKNYSVLLIEAGGEPHPEMEIPAYAYKFVRDPKYVQIYPSVPQRNAGLINNGIINYRHGATLGGGSAVNGMLLNRGSPHDYNNWGDMTGDQSWNYSNMLKYFKKYENYSGEYPSDQRGVGGPITVNRPKYAPGVDNWYDAGREFGFPIAEPNGPQIISFAGGDYCHKFGKRVSSYYGYIKPLLESLSDAAQNARNNLRILVNSTANRIIFQGNKAIAVKFTKNSTTEGVNEVYARAKKEVIVSAGVIGSPVLLQKSGIGPKSVLEKAKIKVVKELPVGKSFQDHAALVQTFIYNNKSATFNRDKDLTPAAYKEYLKTGDGPFTSYIGGGGQAFVEASFLSSPNYGVNRSNGWADFQIGPVHIANNLTITGNDNVPGNELAEDEVAVKWVYLLGRPKSRGSVTLNTSDVNLSPLIDFQYFSHPDDLRNFVEGIKFSVKLCEESKSLQKIGCRIPKTPLKACQHLDFRSDAYWNCFVKQLTDTGMHGAGTCKMGRGWNDPEAVVDPQLRVLGVRGLRIVDGSIMPAITNANVQGAIYAIAEKASEMIISSWRG